MKLETDDVELLLEFIKLAWASGAVRTPATAEQVRTLQGRAEAYMRKFPKPIPAAVLKNVPKH